MEIDSTRLNYGPKKFVIWLFIVASVMIFAALTSAYVVLKAQGHWLHFLLPSVFNFTTIVIIASSVTLHLSYIAAQRLKFERQKALLWLTLFLGLVFLGGQWMAWTVLVHNGVFFSGNPSGSFLYVISGFHAVHIFGGLFLIIYALIGIYTDVFQATNLFRLQVAGIFWHFLDVLWIYLYVFLLLNQ